MTDTKQLKADSQFKHVKTVLIANRGEIACRIISSCKSYGLESVAIYSKEDTGSLHVSQADRAILIPGIGSQAYIDLDSIVSVAVKAKADVVIPGYGFLSENSNFAQKLEEKGIIFAGPSSDNVEQFGLKHIARQLAIKANVPVVPGTELVDTLEVAKEEGAKIGYPLMLKSTAGGGGMGLKVCEDEAQLETFFGEVKSRGQSLFSNTGVFIEKYVQNARHIEIQLFGNGLGDVITFGERECSIQRRHQKVIEESPSPFTDFNLRKKLSLCAISLASQVKYKSAGTIEFLVDDDTSEFYFLEMNTRLQVEHGISELVYGVDLVYLMLLQADYEISKTGIPLEVLQAQSSSSVKDEILEPKGNAIEVRLYAENPVKNFSPSPGILHQVSLPAEQNIRIDHWISTGTKVSPYFDPLLAKIMAWGEDRKTAIENLVNYLEKSVKICGPPTNIYYLIGILKSQNFHTGFTLTSFLNSFKFEPNLIEFEEAGAYTTIQDLPGRVSINGGVPQSGPVDPLSLQIANIIVGNHKYTECLEINLAGPTIKFHSPAIIALAGAAFEFEINGERKPLFTELYVEAGSIVEIGTSQDKFSSKCYLAIKGGFPDVAEYLGSKSCTPTLALGGHQGRVIFPGDCLTVKKGEKMETGYVLPEISRPKYDVDSWTIRMLRGPHDTEDIISKEGLKKLYDTTFTVNLNSNRGGTRLDGPAVEFSRTSGGDGGSHPSNILEYPYPFGGLSAVGSSSVMYGPDGGTLSGFVCVSVPTLADSWKMGQAGTGAPIKLKLISYDDSLKLKEQRSKYIAYLETKPSLKDAKEFDDELKSYSEVNETLLHHRPAQGGISDFYIKQAGEKMIVMDFGIVDYDLLNNGRQYVLDLKMKDVLKEGIVRIESTTGAMCLVFDSDLIDRDYLVEQVAKLEASIPAMDQLKVPSRIFKFPIAFDHKALTHCIERYRKSQRPHAPYLPSNTDFVMRANCIETVEDFKAAIVGHTQIVVAVSFLCALPLLVHTDPRLRFLSSKYNPARTFTPAGAIGTGAIAQAIYTVDSPGGYMIWGMSLPNGFWDTFSKLKGFNDVPWILHNFDQVQFYEVTEEELTKMNNDLLTGEFEITYEDGEFDFEAYIKWLKTVEDEAKEIKKSKLLAIDELIKEEDISLAKWEEEKELAKSKETKSSSGNVDDLINDPTVTKVKSHMAANVFKINYKKGDVIALDDVVIILEAMKMEISVRVKSKEGPKFEILEVVIEEGDMVNPGDVLALVKSV